MATWTPHPHPGAYQFSADTLPQHWAILHCCDAEPCPSDPAILQAWALFHNGDFEAAAAAGRAAGPAGTTVCNKATAIYANYLEQREQTRLELFLQVAEQAQQQAAQEPDNASAWYWNAYALGRYSQGISVAKALAQGLGIQVKDSLEKAIALNPRHADAHIALGAFHAEVIDKVGALIGGMTYGAKKDVGLALFREGLRLHPQSVIGMIEYANALVMLKGEQAMDEATQWYEKAAASAPVDAMDHLDVDMARTELAEG